ncbi:16S rRNA (guanine(966)-N(2))-methyltransferase RsmD [Paenibacillus sp. JX-17]|uniref:16S rRNA (Guanine(966)-N(2))-methyltransferase RsmD n=1 Tax=Paenibacillus lacisoli TaxID=3064525 RepID=A0ABT9C9E1_9BACL|nr:16S rRNA (guanine(966)-N(2))-methyltransferase RsmD [Paenibacillus sp. JX-17]MDO7905883.1 16S rRNA (guanine(966)-N(2))-methyltransferase RsmD [Paenibacillus sp. JX-17]
MRVVSGTAKGRPLKAVPGSGTRPTTDKVKEALFSMIGPYFDGGQALDLFAGSGGLGIEALSRGMSHAVFIDMEPKSIEVIRENLKKTGLAEQSEVYRNDAQRAIKVLAKKEARFDMVFLDPPYRLKFGDKLMTEMHERGLLADGATMVLEYESGYEYPADFGPFRHLRKAVYGETAVSIYEYIAAGPEAAADQGHVITTSETEPQGGSRNGGEEQHD